MKIKFNDETILTINEGASLSRIEVPVQGVTTDAIIMVINTKNNLNSVQFLNDNDEVVGNYTDMKMETPCSVEIMEGETVVVFGMVEKSDIEKRLDAIESGQEIQDGAISELAEVVSEVVGGEA